MGKSGRWIQILVFQSNFTYQFRLIWRVKILLGINNPLLPNNAQYHDRPHVFLVMNTWVPRITKLRGDWKRSVNIGTKQLMAKYNNSRQKDTIKLSTIYSPNSAIAPSIIPQFRSISLFSLLYIRLACNSQTEGEVSLIYCVICWGLHSAAGAGTKYSLI